MRCPSYQPEVFLLSSYILPFFKFGSEFPLLFSPMGPSEKVFLSPHIPVMLTQMLLRSHAAVG